MRVCVLPSTSASSFHLLSSSTPRPLLLFRWEFTATQKMSSSGCPRHCTLSLLLEISYQEHSHNIAHKTAHRAHINAPGGPAPVLWRTCRVFAFNLNTHGQHSWKIALVSIKEVLPWARAGGFIIYILYNLEKKPSFILKFTDFTDLTWINKRCLLICVWVSEMWHMIQIQITSN